MHTLNLLWAKAHSPLTERQQQTIVWSCRWVMVYGKSRKAWRLWLGGFYTAKLNWKFDFISTYLNLFTLVLQLILMESLISACYVFVRPRGMTTLYLTTILNQPHVLKLHAIALLWVFNAYLNYFHLVLWFLERFNNKTVDNIRSCNSFPAVYMMKLSTSKSTCKVSRKSVWYYITKLILMLVLLSLI